MSDSSALDLAHIAVWFGVQPGMTRAAALEVLRQQPGIEIDDVDEEWVTAEGDDWEMDLWFKTEGEDRLWQVALTASGMAWNGQPIHEARLDTVLQAMEPLGPAMWTARNAVDDPTRDEPPATPPTDADLLGRGTLWLATRRLGLAMRDGCVEGVAWREPRDFPRHFAGPLTDAQRALAQHGDLAEHLEAQRTRVPPPRPAALWVKLATFLLVAALAATFARGLQETKRWHQATLIQGKIAALERVPYRTFRDFAPPALQWLFPNGTPRMVDGYRLAYTDPLGQPQELLAAHGDFIVYAYEIGQEVPIAWIAGPPPQARTYYRSRDFGFLEYVPWAISFAALYAIVLVTGYIVTALLRRRAKTGGG